METVQNNVAQEAKKKKQIKWWYPGEKHKGGYDWKWISINLHKWNKPDGIRFTIGPASYFDNRLSVSIGLCWINIYLHLPVYSTIDECEHPEYGFYYHENALVLCYGYKTKFLWMPWNKEWVRTSKLRADGSWYIEKKGQWKKWRKDNPDANLSKQWEAEKAAEGELWSQTYHYKYTTKYGEVQDDIEATISVEEREWRPRWFMWTNLFKTVRKSIDVRFSKEVGSERGSWKGGCTGCGYTMLPEETPVQTLRRMEKERSFDR